MLALQKTEDLSGLELRDVAPPPPPGRGEIQIGIIATGICGTDLKVEEWSPGLAAMVRPALPVTLGHETIARVLVCGEGVDNLAPGNLVVINPAIACGQCAACISGDTVGCLDRQAFGLVRHGAFASRANVDSQYAFRFPDWAPAELGALIEPLTIGAYALDVAGFSAGDAVVIFGPGPIGQGAAVLAREMGAAKIVVVGCRDAHRLAAVRDMGFEDTADIGDEGGTGHLRALAGAGFDIAIDAAGSAGAINQALELLRPQGILALVGMGDTIAKVDVGLVVRNRLQLRGVSRIPPQIWPQVIERVSANPKAFEPLITHRMPLSEAMHGFALCRSGEATKVLLFPEHP